MKVTFKNWNVLLIFSILLAAAFGVSIDKNVFAYTTDSEIFINEIHYDNAGTDADEGVEIGARAGTDLTGWSLVAYNGSNGTLYDTLVLSGTITDQQNGFGTKFFAIPGLQNGAPDGIALVKPDNSVVMFLSYEGSFAATGGPAIGLTSTDIGVSQSGSDAAGMTLQLSGVGFVYEQFTWQPPAASTYNLSNNNQTFGSLVIENIIPICPAGIITYPGEAVSDVISASDADGTVLSATISSTPVAGISLMDIVPAAVEGGELTGTLDVADTTLGGYYDVEITFSNDDITPQTATCTVPVTVVPETCPLTNTHEIGAVQGETDASPVVGQVVTVSGIVVTDFQTGLQGYTIQDLDGDGNALTSDGVFVYNASFDVNVGDPVQVTATVSEYEGLTELTSISATSLCGSRQSIPDPIVLTLPQTTSGEFERYEGMLVTFPQELVMSEYYNFARYGQIVLTSTRHMSSTAQYEPGSSEQQQAVLDYMLDKITLDDSRSAQNPDPAIHPDGNVFNLTNLFRGGDLVANITGILDQYKTDYRIQPTQGADYTAVNDRPEDPPMVGGELKVASFNVLNYFTTLDLGPDICGPAENMECRGADNAEEFTRQRAKIIAAISEIDADVVGLMEIENNLTDNAVINLVAGLNDAIGDGTYAYVDTGVIGTDAIKVAMIYKPDMVTLTGNHAILDSDVDLRFLDDRNRPALAQSFTDPRSGNIFTVAVNHLKSKGSACTGDPDLSDGAGNCNVTRTNAALALVDWLAGDPTLSGSENYLIIGDLNSYDKEDPINAILAGADDTLNTDDDYTDLIFKFQGDLAYGYVFDGQVGYLDHALANAGMEAFVSGVDFWHINADEPNLIDYDTSFKQPAQDALYEPDAYRSSDHDPVIIGLKFLHVYYFPLIGN